MAAAIPDAGYKPYPNFHYPVSCNFVCFLSLQRLSCGKAIRRTMELTGEKEPDRRKRMKKTMIATVLGLALMPLTFAAETPAKHAVKSTAPAAATDSAKPAVKKAKKNHKKPAVKAPAHETTPAAAPAQK